jgi:hypothetical protein
MILKTRNWAACERGARLNVNQSVGAYEVMPRHFELLQKIDTPDDDFSLRRAEFRIGAGVYS